MKIKEYIPYSLCDSHKYSYLYNMSEGRYTRVYRSSVDVALYLRDNHLENIINEYMLKIDTQNIYLNNIIYSKYCIPFYNSDVKI